MLYLNAKELPTIPDLFRNSAKFQSRNVYPKLGCATIQKKISLCITSMNRLHDLQLSLPQNLDVAESYPNTEFVVLDYDSKDGLEEWARLRLKTHIESGRLVYYRVTHCEHFRPNHSRNLSFRLATGEVIANVDADNLIHEGYIERINDCMSIADRGVIAVPQNYLEPNSDRMLLRGRFAIHKPDMELLRGFDEDLDQGFGNDDVNFVLRATLAGFQLARFEAKFTEGRLPTSDEDRVKYVKNKNIKMILDHNLKITREKLCKGIISVNPKSWGVAEVVKNFSEKIVVQ